MQHSRRNFLIAAAGTIVGIAVLLTIAFVAIGFTGPHPIGRDWIAPPFGETQVRQLERGETLRHHDTEGRFMLIAPSEMRAEVLESHRIFVGNDANDLIRKTANQKGPWLAGTLDGHPTLVLEFPSRFVVATSHSLGGYVITPTRKADGTITLDLSEPKP